MYLSRIVDDTANDLRASHLSVGAKNPVNNRIANLLEFFLGWQNPLSPWNQSGDDQHGCSSMFKVCRHRGLGITFCSMECIVHPLVDIFGISRIANRERLPHVFLGSENPDVQRFKFFTVRNGDGRGCIFCLGW